ncbi:MAG: tRNA (adenosine(37)-N6)-threonylcarbamoyltransferase complex transferase subunit TsaD [Coriobacteriia bacterium]|nr:tRNA (adenosine(37)-N6)-threonylcarbamoyltransferase complex transferase subunit TsaD [Coriobacteriia bacterium]
MSKYVLTFDTSSNDIVINLAAFAYDEQRLLSVIAKTHPAPRAANTQLLTHIDAALNQAGVNRSELAAVAVGVTLGSYTGVRIGVATAKGITQALGIPLYGLAIDEEQLSPDHLLDCFDQTYFTQTGDPGTVLPQYTQLSYAEEAEKKQHPARYSSSDASGHGDNGGDSRGNDGADISVDSATSAAAPAAALSAVSLRALTPYDLDALHTFSDEVAYFNWSRQQYADELQSTKTLWLGAFLPAADGHQQLVGYIGTNVAVTEAEMLQVSVRLEYRKQGIAARMFDLLFEHLQEQRASSLTLEVRQSNSSAQNLYKKLGFEQVASRSDYYSNPLEDAVILQKALTNFWQSSENQACVEGQVSRLLGIETSCDETAVAVMEGTALLSNVVASQVVFHARFGGVVPEIASRKHSEAIVAAVDQAMVDAKLPFSALTGIAATDRPGLIGALVVGQAYAKGLAWVLQVPLYGINHLEGHLYACAIEDESDGGLTDLPSPYVALIVSGGHTALIHSPRPHTYRTLGETLDDAAGEAFDKVAKVLGLGYPGGPILSKLADKGNPHAIDFPRALMHSKDYSFSLSGLKTAVITYIRQAEEAGDTLNIPDVAASFQQAVVDVQVAKAVRAVREADIKHFIMAGGVAANKVLREALTEALSKEGVEVHIPPLKYCGDNAAMIVRTAVARLQANEQASRAAGDFSNTYLRLDADCNSSGPLD